LIETVKVGVAELEVSDNHDILASFGLGSCVAIAIYDPVKGVGGLAHVMLPESLRPGPPTMPGKFADTAVEHLIEELLALGARKKNLESKLVGGAQMFEMPGSRSANPKVACGPSVNIGARNIIAAKEALEGEKIPVVGEDIGGNHGRTVRFNTSTGEVEISSIRFGKSTL